MRPFLPCPPSIAPIRITHPVKPVGDPASVPQPDPAPQRPNDPTGPVHAPQPREPELPAVDPHQPTIPTPRIGDPAATDRWRRDVAPRSSAP